MFGFLPRLNSDTICLVDNSRLVNRIVALERRDEQARQGLNRPSAASWGNLQFAKFLRQQKPKAVWVEPSLTAEVEYGDITSEGLLRQSSCKGLKRN